MCFERFFSLKLPSTAKQQHVLACQFADFNIISSMPEQYLMNNSLSVEPKSTSLLSESQTAICVTAALRP